MELKMKKRIGFSLAISSAVAVLFVAFTNTTTLNNPLPALIAESQKINERMNSNLSATARDIYRLHKMKIANVIAVETKARNCNDLMSVDSSTLTGNYDLYPNGLENPAVSVYCVNPSVIISIINSILLDD